MSLLAQGGRGAAPAAPPPPLFALKAGLLHSSPAPPGGAPGVSLKADKRKGELILKRDPDGLLHVQWVDRVNGNLGFDYPVFEGDVTLKRIQAPNVRKVGGGGENRRVQAQIPPKPAPLAPPLPPPHTPSFPALLRSPRTACTN